MISYFLAFLLAFGVAAALTPLVRRAALRWGIVDEPTGGRKIHTRATPLLGGLGVFGAFTLIVLGYTLATDQLFGGYLLPKHVAGLILGGAILMIGGYLDDRHHLRPSRQILFPIAASLVIIASGIGVEYIRNPFGEAIQLDAVKWAIFEWNGVPYSLTLFADLFALVWLLGMMYTTKFLDGLDGLVPGVGVIGSVILFFLSLSKEVAQPETALLAIIFAGACLGFLVWNWHPAKIFLGEGGSLFVGFLLGVLAIISGAKVATALLVMGVPILDVLWVIVRRLWTRTSVAVGDRKHLHFRLLDAGLSHRAAVCVLYLITIAFGVSSLFLETSEKVKAFAVLGGMMLALILSLTILYKRKK
ncbi:MAG: undecaprenyl/decaprenyl-phosphate alpha-N-acetylglucosaminyl 1-phosphate transferase [Candidatus Kerfeldbacteria bacterium]|nr:undecaprenyl/decaprenyl-phosphate alpha-N-acetylglucosaminyl 1-phosphate transferase [Candidatus Kerfeldbacteria bacterium]